MNPFDLLKNLNIDDLKKQTQDLSEKLDNITAIGESGGGFVKVTLNGHYKILNIEYEDNQFIKEDLNTFKDLIIAAYNSASDQIREKVKSQVSGLLLPGIM
ncbi:MAG: nucleoid-associated protein, YbaB/EbfC family [Spirochaetes bacterium GWF1_31_7]|nr:MAG: nucleoid-associated protein, YbaB/EbfC family [Spirochaetes bacterium GWE1_32_154]OHD50024.1 MAG: nucleoid-associated protein, YbaB/EbfC family [Spirochaetes bacterium GWE2_31_10]OHD52338.1 MAG: nucleoid-associated protein, YbaB/EbfC family [Spirochaetes bacterium GWF1_31_7]OHD73185.1 MAG: nucleoid-associated protein, YbaB/EbfC family [Spirochaetes bacterium RIFOXYB1_FULL_32_8]HBI38489.1 nucleoid-associated protein, YbaB/EbfC family [Spirochaetia bacterium]